MRSDRKTPWAIEDTGVTTWPQHLFIPHSSHSYSMQQLPRLLL